MNSNKVVIFKDTVSYFPVIFIVTVVIGGTSFGLYNTAVVNNLYPIVVDYLNDTNASLNLNSNPNVVWSIVVGAYSVGCGIGTISSALLAEHLGRKIGLMVSAVFNVCGGVICLFYLNLLELSIAGRLLMGISFGIGLPLASTFITEIAPIKYRGACMSALQLGCSFGDVTAMVLSLPQLLGTLPLSKFALSFSAITSFVMFCVLFAAYESPRYLILKLDKLESGRKAVIFYQGRTNVDEIMEEIISEKLVGSSAVNNKKNICKTIVVFEKPLIVACVCLMLPVLSGIPLIAGYSTDALNNNHLPTFITPYCSMAIAIFNFLFSILSIRLIERCGRKVLFKLGLIGTFSGLLLFTVFSLVNNFASVSNYFGYSLVLSMIIYISFYPLFSSACITLSAEICSQNFRSYAIAIGNLCQTIVSTILVLTYEHIKFSLGISWVFFPFSFLSLVLGVAMFIILPETVGITLTDIKRLFLENK